MRHDYLPYRSTSTLRFYRLIALREPSSFRSWALPFSSAPVVKKYPPPPPEKRPPFYIGNDVLRGRLSFHVFTSLDCNAAPRLFKCFPRGRSYTAREMNNSAWRIIRNFTRGSARINSAVSNCWMKELVIISIHVIPRRMGSFARRACAVTELFKRPP